MLVRRVGKVGDILEELWGWRKEFKRLVVPSSIQQSAPLVALHYKADRPLLTPLFERSPYTGKLEEAAYAFLEALGSADE